MRLTPKIKQAIDLSAVLHQNQKRKGSGIPYASHPYGVAFILNNYSEDEDVIVAGLLHDVLEDVSTDLYDEAKMRAEFGDRVTGFVKEVSENKSLPTWEARKANYYTHLKTATQEALLISAADLTHNLTSMIETQRVQGKKFLDSFNAPPEEMLKVYAARIAIIKKRLNTQLISELEAAYAELAQAARG